MKSNIKGWIYIISTRHKFLSKVVPVEDAGIPLMFCCGQPRANLSLTEHGTLAKDHLKLKKKYLFRSILNCCQQNILYFSNTEHRNPLTYFFFPHNPLENPGPCICLVSTHLLSQTSHY